MPLVDMLNLRTRFEEITADYKFKEPMGSDINSLKWFLEFGHQSNSLRNDFREALEIAEAIITEYENNDREYENSSGLR